jgi:four helix bundle protein
MLQWRLRGDFVSTTLNFIAKQMRRAALSISNNIAEGHGRWYYQENMRFCRTSRGSIEEIIDDLNTCIDESYADGQQIEKLKEEAESLIARINGYIAYLRRTQQGNEPA